MGFSSTNREAREEGVKKHRSVVVFVAVCGVGLLGWMIASSRTPVVAEPSRETTSGVATVPALDTAESKQIVPPDSANLSADESTAKTEARLADLEQSAEERLALCKRVAGKLGSVSLSDCTESGLEPSGARSVSGLPILVAEYPPLPGREPLGKVLLFGGIHGDEYSSVSIVYKWLKTLDQYHSGLFHWQISPLINPDGLLGQKSQRMNKRGVDLNRNFPSPNWKVEAEDYWVRRTSRNPRRYPGKEPLSEPESRYLHRLIEEFQPAAIVAVHAPSKVVDYDGPQEPPQKLGPLYLKQMGTYPGSLGRYAGLHLGLPVVTIELPSAGIMPSEDEQRRMWIDLVAWLRKNVPIQTAARRLEESEASLSASGL